MFLLIHKCKATERKVFSFTFQYVSINTPKPDDPKPDDPTLHSNMFLLIPVIAHNLD